MKTIKNIIILLFVLNISIIFGHQTLFAQHVGVSFQLFYDQLGPYGRWVDYPSYGNVWIPNVGPGFVPYCTSGHWVYSDEYGWTWVSDYPWGWAPFHYGRWMFEASYGWFWVPGTEWGPAWVVWRHSPGYYGWAPLAPGISISIALGGGYNIPHERWMFVRDRYMGNRHINKYYINHGNSRDIFRNSEIIRNSRADSRHVNYFPGPDRSEIDKVRSKRVKSVSIIENNRPGQSFTNKQLKIYRPEVTQNKNDRVITPPNGLSGANRTNPQNDRRMSNRVKGSNPPPQAPVHNNQRESGRQNDRSSHRIGRR
jgi:hypothetical protein